MGEPEFARHAAQIILQQGEDRNVQYQQRSPNNLAGNQTGTTHMGISLSSVCCRSASCGNRAVIAFAGRDLCLDHFLTSCFERLDELENAVYRRSLDGFAEMQKIQDSLEECSNQTLLVCLRHEPLSNLERSRLLGILLQCEELRQLFLRRPMYASVPSASA